MKNITSKFLLAALFIAFSAAHVSAKIELPSVLGSNMVLQQQTDVKLWGKAKPDSKVTAITSWNKKTYSAQSDKHGDWLMAVPTPEAGGPYEITFSDGESLKLENVLIGEVWLCSGQSNMEMPMRGFDRQPTAGCTDVIAKAKPSTPIRMFNTDSENGRWIRQFSKKPQTNIKGQWMVNSPENVANISAAAYFFAQYLQEVLEVPVGIIVSSRGGSKIEAWLSREAISGFKDINLSMLDDDTDIGDPTAVPCVLYNGKIAPFTNFAIKGLLWYQGESNRDNPEQYEQLAPAMVKDFRSRWGTDLPFYFVEIAPFDYEGADGTSGARLREAQLQNMKDIPNSGMVTTLDAGSPIFIHPVDKKTVGNRLAYWALAQTYGKKGFEYATPYYKSMEKAGNKIYINIEDAPSGICPMWTALEGFEIAGADRVFHPANAEIETKTTRLAVSCDKVPDPVAVRYAYKNTPKASIFSIGGIPVAPFRTDDWPVKSSLK